MRKISQAQCGGRRGQWPGHMARAFEVARSVLSCAPNPRVGCVIVRDDRRIAEGFHAGAGRDHAETAALATCPEGAAGATVFVTLEPCSHRGRTGPCTAALIGAGVKRVVVAGLDPNPRVAGGAELEAAGIEFYLLEGFTAAAAELNPGYFKRHHHGRPHLRCKLAMSIDGRTALASGESKWITDAAARADAQLLRARSCAIVTGINTVLADDPALNVRPEALTGAARDLARQRLDHAGQPLRTILDSGLRTPVAAKTLALPGAVKIFAVGGPESAADYPPHVEIIKAPARGQRVDLGFVLDSLAANFDCHEVLLEAGPVLAGAAVAAGLVDELVVYMGGRLLGGDARPLLELPAVDSLEECIAPRIQSVSKLGDCVKLVARPAATTRGAKVT